MRSTLNYQYKANQISLQFLAEICSQLKKLRTLNFRDITNEMAVIGCASRMYRVDDDDLEKVYCDSC